MSADCCGMQEKPLPDSSTAPKLGVKAKSAKKKEPNPLDNALEILEKYTEGTPKYERLTDHWGE